MGFMDTLMAGSQYQSSVDARRERTRQLYLDTEYKKAAEATGAELGAKMKEWDNMSALKEAEIQQVEDEAMVDGDVDEGERKLLKLQRGRLEQQRFDFMMENIAQVTTAGATNPYIEAMVKPLFEQTTQRYQKFYNDTAAEFEEHQSKKERESRSQITATEQQGAWDRANLAEQGALDRVLAQGEQERQTQAAGAKLGVRGKTPKPVDPLQIEDSARTNVQAKHAKQINEGAFTPEMWDTAMRIERRELTRTWSRAGMEISEEGSAEPEVEETALDEETEARKQRTLQLESDIGDVETGVLDLEEYGKDFARTMRGKRHTPESRAEAESRDVDLQEAKSTLAELKQRLKEMGSGNVSHSLEKNRAARATLREKYAKGK